MKDERYTSIVCEKFCYYYKPQRDEQLCEGYSFLRRNLTPNELKDLVTVFKISKSLSNEREYFSLCNSCDFRVDGCDFYAKQSNVPCGGLLIISSIQSLIDF